ncbi:MAG: DUF1993 domain-containing protein [Proteobacteria bacterium]|nr:DUF1993 domain-containing protein [Pseudomonadota bacterium]
MATSLYDLSVGTYLQVVGAAVGFLDKGASYCNEKGIALDDVVKTNLYDDMQSFHFQVICITHHSIGAIKALQTGEAVTPMGLYADTDYAGLQALTSQTLTELKALDKDAINKLSDGKLIFKLGKNELPFTNENYVLSFSLPNFYFHATTAYDILRSKGVPLGKRDFLGAMRMGA